MMDESKRRDYIVDRILVELNELGRFQLLQYLWISTIVVLMNAAYFSYVFTAGQLDYR